MPNRELHCQHLGEITVYTKTCKEQNFLLEVLYPELQRYSFLGQPSREFSVTLLETPAQLLVTNWLQFVQTRLAVVQDISQKLNFSLSDKISAKNSWGTDLHFVLKHKHYNDNEKCKGRWWDKKDTMPSFFLCSTRNALKYGFMCDKTR